MNAPLLSYVRTSWAWLRQDPLTLSVLGLAVVASSSAVCCFGVGMIFAGWFGCELLASLLRAATGVRVPKTRAWFSAGVVLMGAVGLMAAAGWLSFLGLRAEMPVLEGVPKVLDTDIRIAAITTVAVLLALHFILPMSFVPIWLIERGGHLGDAVAASTTLVSRVSTPRFLAVSLMAHGVQFAPGLIVSIVVAILLDRASVPYAVALTLPILVVTTPLGQGVFVAAYHDLSRGPAAPRSFRPLSKGVRLLLGGVVFVPVLTLALLGVSLAQPSHPHRVAASVAGELVASTDAKEAVLHIPDTVLVVEKDKGHIRVSTLDGGGAGRLRISHVVRVRVLRVRDAYAIEMTSRDGSLRATWIDRAGVRLDDNLSERIADHLPWWGIAALCLYSLLAPLAFRRALLPVVTAVDTDAAQVATARAVHLLGSLLVPGVACIVAGVLAVLG